MKKWLAIVFFLFIGFYLQAQSVSVKIDVKDKPLNLVLVQLRDSYGFHFSFSDNILSKYKITLTGTYSSKDEVVQNILRGLPFEIRKSDDVYLIIPKREEPFKTEIKEKRGTQVKGQIVEAETFEPLAFSHIMINNKAVVSDVQGNFSFTASSDSSLHLSISHLGYYVFDTIINASLTRKFSLMPSDAKLPEITVQNNVIEKSSLVGDKPGKINLNHNIAKFIPGQGDNSVFNLLRLMPGITAAGEQSSDLLIWGSYESHSLVTFDGFTVFGLKNFNDNISVINPFVVKNIDVYKGGYDARYGDRVGGIVLINGKTSSIGKPSFTANISNATLNGMAEVPLFKKSSLLLAYRQTYYNLYRNSSFDLSSTTGKSSSSKNPITFDVNVYPDDYHFRDMNLKYSYHFDNGAMFYLSTYGGGDFFNLNAESERSGKDTLSNGTVVGSNVGVTVQNEERNKQQGASAFFGKQWKDGNSSRFFISHSFYKNIVSNVVEIYNYKKQEKNESEEGQITNHVAENSFRTENTLNFRNGYFAETGGGFYENEVNYSNELIVDDSSEEDIDTTNHHISYRAYCFFQETIPLSPRIQLKAGIRPTFASAINKVYLEPRFSAEAKITGSVKANFAFGRYHQFVYKTITVDKNGNYNYYWTSSDDDVPALSSTHYIGSVSYFKNDLTLNVEGFYKPTDGITRTKYQSKKKGSQFLTGDARSYGIDLYAKKELKKLSLWASCSWGKAQERLAQGNSDLPEYTAAPHDQRYELKFAGIYKFWSCYFSANYVYGSGIELVKNIAEEQNTSAVYSRLDASATWKFSKKWLSGELGFSVLNILNHQNIKYSNLKQIEVTDYGSVTIYSDAVPFTPTVFLNVKF